MHSKIFDFLKCKKSFLKSIFCSEIGKLTPIFFFNFGYLRVKFKNVHFAMSLYDMAQKAISLLMPFINLASSFNGSSTWARTRDLRINRQQLYQTMLV